MEAKKNLIDLRQRWDALYQTTMECEVKTEIGLKPLQEFKNACNEFEKWLATVEEKLEYQMIDVGSTKELTQQLETCQVRTMFSHFLGFMWCHLFEWGSAVNRDTVSWVTVRVGLTFDGQLHGTSHFSAWKLSIAHK